MAASTQIKLRLKKGRSYTGKVKATLANPFVTAADEKTAAELIRSGYFERVKEKAKAAESTA
ncbi:MAG: hypothetical protein LBT21_06315 [Oscillospiraceae bacterium]|jgi:hypothetical protein|nr:hypothetical protein [Oscillospiraceae bacterium]